MQSLGCDVAALNTVQFSRFPRISRSQETCHLTQPGNHTGYGQWTGTKTTAQEITDLYRGLKQSHLDDFDMMLSGYVPGAEALEAVGAIAKELKAKASARPGSFFWVLDPVMGDNGTLYVAQDVVPVYRSLVPYADLILPNQFEAEYAPPSPLPPIPNPSLTPQRRLLSDVKIIDMPSLSHAIEVLHERYAVPHIVITSVSLPSTTTPTSTATSRSLSVVGSTMTSSRRPRAFQILFPAIECYFSGTGDMFAALTVVRMREAVWNSTPRLSGVEAWRSADNVDALDLPLARAVERVLASMHEVLTRTRGAMATREGNGAVVNGTGEKGAGARLARSKAAELRLVRHLDCLRFPQVEFRAVRV